MGWINSYLQYTSEQESPTLFHKWCAVSVIASVVNRQVWLDRRSSRGTVYFTDYPGQLSICLVAGAGCCKKSTAVTIAKHFMKDAGVNLFDGKIPPERLLRKLGSMPNGKPVLTIVASEMSSFISKASYNDSLIENLIKLLDCESSPYETQKFQTQLSEPCLTLLMATTPYSFGKSVPPQAHDTGYLSRHIHIYSDKPGLRQSLNANEADIDPAILNAVSDERTDLVLYLKGLQHLSGPFQWTKAGQKWFNDYYEAYSNSSMSMGEGYPQRRPSHMLRLAMCLQLSESPDLHLSDWAQIEADKWLTEVEGEMSRAFAFIGRHANSDEQDRILNVFRKKAAATRLPQPLITGEELYYETLRFMKDTNELRIQLRGLMDAGIIMHMGNNDKGVPVYVLVKEPY